VGVALARKRTRRIIVDGVVYRWKVRRKLSHAQEMGLSPLTLVVEQAEVSGALLVISLPKVDDWTGWPYRIVRPATVASGVKLALARGWLSSRPGPAFTLTLDESLVEADER
jgi:hypothetical protein